MTQDEYEVGSLENAEKFAIIRMAREAGLIWQRGNLDVVKNSISQLERFAAQVTAHEREACAKVCDDIGDSDNGYGCAAAIRSRSNEH